MAVPTDSGDMDDGEVPLGLGCALNFFKEAEEIQKMIDDLLITYKNSVIHVKCREHFSIILKQYQEQPHLLDHHLEKMVSKLVFYVKEKSSSLDLVHASCEFLHIITKVRNYKTVLRFLPHEVNDLAPVLTLLEKETNSINPHWETLYMLLLWLSIIIMIPFDLKRFDAFPGGGEFQSGIVDRIEDLCKVHVAMKYCEPWEAASYLAAKFFIRPDMVNTRLSDFLSWLLLHLTDSQKRSKLGILRTLYLIFKHGKRDDVLCHAIPVLKVYQSLTLKSEPEIVVRKHATKLVQRIGLTFMKVKIAPWRYQRGVRSLTAFQLTHQPIIEAPKLFEENQTDDYDIPAEIEEVLEDLLQGLKDKATEVRYSAAKGIGRVTERLPQEFADDVVGSVLELFSVGESDQAWHGGCLSLAELGRRGLLLPERLATVIPVLMKALVYEEFRGNYSVGSHIRDGACYVCWAFARAYDPTILQPFIMEISRTLVSICLFDREVNCRRAAAAAFQEMVGRLGTVPHGIDIITTVDYNSVAILKNSYLVLSVLVAEHGEYFEYLVSHLLEKKIMHWDISIRKLAAQALNKMTFINPEYMKNIVIPNLIPVCNGKDLHGRHGAIFSLSEVVHALYLCSLNKNVPVFDESLVKAVSNITSLLLEKKQFRGLGGELMRQSINTLITKTSMAKFPLQDHPIIGEWETLLYENIYYNETGVQSSAVEAIGPFLHEYYLLHHDSLLKCVKQFCGNTLSKNPSTRRGAIAALGHLTYEVLRGVTDLVTVSLLNSFYDCVDEAKWAEARKEVLRSLVNILTILDDDASSLSDSRVTEILACFTRGLDDYSQDNRGGVGAWVREASIAGFQILLPCVVKNKPSLMTKSMYEDIIGNLIQHGMEIIDRVRGVAVGVFYSLLHHKNPEITLIPEREKLLSLFDETTCKDMNWSCERQTYPLFVQILDIPCYRKPVLIGLTLSIGGMTGSLVECSSHCVMSYLSTAQEESLHIFVRTMIEIFQENLKKSRITYPLLMAMDRFLNSCHLNSVLALEDSDYLVQIIGLVKQEVQKSVDPKKILSAVDVYCDILQFHGEPFLLSINQLMLLLCHRFPRVRKVTASKFFEALVSVSDDIDLSSDACEKAMDLLSEVVWDAPVETVRAHRNQLCTIFGVKAPVIIKKQN